MSDPTQERRSDNEEAFIAALTLVFQADPNVYHKQPDALRRTCVFNIEDNSLMWRMWNAGRLGAGDWIEWVEPLAGGSEAVHSRALASDVAKVQRQREPRYTSDEQAIEDFMIVHWATRPNKGRK